MRAGSLRAPTGVPRGNRTRSALGRDRKGGLYLEILGRVNTVVLDKTGTLTFGRAVVQSAFRFEGASKSELISSAAAAELRSERPLGKAIVAYAATERFAVREPERFDSSPGLGIVAKVGNSTTEHNHEPLAARGTPPERLGAHSSPAEK